MDCGNIGDIFQQPNQQQQQQQAAGQPQMMSLMPPQMAQQQYQQNQQQLHEQFLKCQDLMHQQYLQGSQGQLTKEQQMLKQQRYMYEEESHYYVDILCDEFCEIGNNNEIVYVEDQLAPEQTMGMASTPAAVSTMDDATHEKSEEIKKKTKDMTDKQREQNMKFNTGRWTDEEHELFLEGLRIYEKDWELVQQHVKTRGIANIRAHGQKFFEKLVKIIESNDSPDEKTKQYYEILSKKVHKSQRWRRPQNEKQDAKLFQIQKEMSADSKQSYPQSQNKLSNQEELHNQNQQQQLNEYNKNNAINQQPPPQQNMEMHYYKWYNEVWPTLYNKDPENHLLKGTISIVKRDSIKSKKSNISNNFSLGHKSQNSIKHELNRRISIKSGHHSLNRQQDSGLSHEKGSGVLAPGSVNPFMRSSFQQALMNNIDEGSETEMQRDNETEMERLEDEEMDNASYNSGSLGNKQLKQHNYMNLLNEQSRRQTLQINPKKFGNFDNQMYEQQQQLQMQIEQQAIQFQLNQRNATIKQLPNQLQMVNNQGSSDSGHMIKMDQTAAQWNTEFNNNGFQPFHGYQAEENLYLKSQTMAVPKHTGDGDDEMAT